MGTYTQEIGATKSDFLADFDKWSSFGGTEAGGLNREAATVAHSAARSWLIDWFEERGLETHVDDVANVFGMSAWLPGRPYILVGSHSDSQPLGGRFDGSYGVLAAAHVLARLDEEVRAGRFKPVFNVAAVDWFNEEGSRFQPSLMGSSVYVGQMDKETALQTTDLDGITVRESLQSFSRRGSVSTPVAAGYAEVHVEQGRDLERHDRQIGLVTGSWPVCKYRMAVLGEQAHVGATDMEDRRDALVGAARVVLAARETPDAFDPGTVLSSVGRFVIEPNSPGVVASRVDIDVDIRGIDDETIRRAREYFEKRLRDISDGEVKVDIYSSRLRPGVTFPADGVQVAERVCSELGLTSRYMLTRAGHDSMSANQIVPTVMLFVPSVNGVSHNEAEFTEDDDLLNGVDVLTEVTKKLAAGALGREAVE